MPITPAAHYHPHHPIKVSEKSMGERIRLSIRRCKKGMVWGMFGGYLGGGLGILTVL